MAAHLLKPRDRRAGPHERDPEEKPQAREDCKLRLSASLDVPDWWPAMLSDLIRRRGRHIARTPVDTVRPPPHD
jgi:hypothetical protein